VGLGLNDGLETITDGVNFAILNNSKQIIESIVTSSSKIPSTIIEVINTPSTETPYVSIGFGSGIEYSGGDVNTIFLYSIDSNNDSLVAFADEFSQNQTSVYLSYLGVDLSFQSNDIIII
jgi:hypothetical protein